jgi:hypothetical protein
VRSRLIALGAVVGVLALAGCTSDVDAPEALPPVHVVEQPAASAGGACILWDYAFVEEMIGVRFTVAAGEQVDDTATCVLQTENAEAPFLVLSITDGVSADAGTFVSEVQPDRATKVKGLGVAGYRLAGKPAKGLGPSVEVGWLSEADQLQTLRFTFAPGADSAAVSAMTKRVVAMAEVMDTTDGKADAK